MPDNVIKSASESKVADPLTHAWPGSDLAGAAVGAGRQLGAASAGSRGGGAGQLQRGLPQGHPGALPVHHHRQAGAGAHLQAEGGTYVTRHFGMGVGLVEGGFNYKKIVI